MTNSALKIIEVDTYQGLSLAAAKIFIEAVRKKPNLVLGLATGSSPLGMYQEMIADHKQNNTSYEHVRTFNLDEYVGLAADHSQSYAYFMYENLFKHLDILLENTYIPNGLSESPDQEGALYEEKIIATGGIDLQILGIGANGHIAFNEPGSPFTSRTRLMELTEDTREANARFFNSIDEVPTHALTSGMATIFDAREIVMIVSGKSKAEAMKQLLTGEISEDFPASILHNHPNATVIVDRDALNAE